MIKCGGLADYESLFECLVEVRNHLFEWEESLPPLYKYNRLTFDTCEGFPLGYYLTYNDFWIASIWNTYRCIALLVNELILDYLGTAASQFSSDSLSIAAADKRFAQDCMDTAIADICATIPFYLGLDRNTGTSNPSIGMPRAAVCESLIWPLYLAASSTQSREEKDWIAKQLDDISCLIGNRQAAAFANVLRTGEDLPAYS